MSQRIALASLWPGFLLSDLQIDTDRVTVRLQPDPLVALVCSRCQRPCSVAHDSRWRRIRDLPMLGRRVDLEVLMRRVACDQCGVRVQHVKWLGRHQRVTQRLAQAVAALCIKLPAAHVAELLDLHWSTVREIDRRALHQRLSGLPPAQPRRLIMDEFALHKGHRYASVVLDADTKRVLWIETAA